jgi:hypothetical protein
MFENSPNQFLRPPRQTHGIPSGLLFGPGKNIRETSEPGKQIWAQSGPPDGAQTSIVGSEGPLGIALRAGSITSSPENLFGKDFLIFENNFEPGRALRKAPFGFGKAFF